MLHLITPACLFIKTQNYADVQCKPITTNNQQQPAIVYVNKLLYLNVIQRFAANACNTSLEEKKMS